MRLKAIITFADGGIREDMETRDFLFSCSPLVSVSVCVCVCVCVCECVERGLVMEINKYNLEPAVCCDMPISLDSFESAIQIGDANANESRLTNDILYRFHSPNPNLS